MTCERRSDVLEALTGSATPDRRRAVEQHLRECIECAQVAEALDEVVGLLRSDPDPTPPPSFWEEFTAGLDRRLRVADRPWSLRRVPPRGVRRLLRAARRGVAVVAAAVVISVIAAPAPPMRIAPAPEAPFRALVSDAVVETLPQVGRLAAEWGYALSAPDLADPLGP